jgi:hypothetical protein
MADDRANDPHRVSEHEEDRQDYFSRKFGYELANPKPDTYEDEKEAAGRKMKEEK